MASPPSPKTKADLEGMDPREFEEFAIGVLRRVYARHNVELIATPPSKDGGKDATADSVLHPDLPEDLQVRILLWVEAKQRTKNVGVYDAGRHLVAAFCNRVNKIIFVTDKGFSSGMKKEIEEFCHRANFVFGLIPGNRLLELANNVNRKTIEPAQGNAEAPDPCLGPMAATTMLAAGRFSEDNSFAKLSQAHLEVSNGEPVFLTVDISAEGAGEPCLGEFELLHSFGDQLRVTAYGPVLQAVLSDGDHLRLRFALWRESPGDFGLDGFRLRHSGTVISLSGEGRVVTTNPILPRIRFRSQDRTLAELESAVRSWIEKPGVLPVALTAPAGQGKTFALAPLRRQWLRNGCRELILDGDTVRNEATLISRLFDHLFPIPPGQVNESQLPVLADWLEGAGLHPKRAVMVARSITTKDSIPEASPRLLAEVVVGLLGNAVANGPLVLVLEDLHKVGHSVLEVLREAISLMKALNRHHCLLVLTSRNDSANIDIDQRQAWRATRDALFGVTTVYALPAPDEEDACEALADVVQGLDKADARRIVSQVGRVPFALKEALLFLSRLEIIRQDNVLGGLALRLPEDLKVRIDTEQLRRSTALRLQMIQERFQPWLGRVVNAAACYGKRFPLKATLEVAQVQISDEVREGLEVCRRECVIGSAREGMFFAFDHDLVRSTALQEMPEVDRLESASAWLGALTDDADLRVRTSLSYLAARGDDFVRLAEAYSDERLGHHRYGDAAESLTLALAVVDSKICGREALQDAAVAFDDGLAGLPIPKLTKTPTPEHILGLSCKTLDCHGMVSAGTSRLEEGIINAADLLARKVGNDSVRAILLRRRGKMSLERGDPDGALASHRGAEDLFARIAPTSGGSLSHERFDNGVELAITLRHVGLKEESQCVLQSLESSLRPDQVRERIRCLANLGALDFYANPDGCRRAWELAQEISAHECLPESEVHMLLDLADLDVAEGKWERAIGRIKSAMAMAEDLGLENERLRGNLLRGVLAMIKCDWELASDFFKDAERIGLDHSIGRRLWKCRSNGATVADLRGDHQAAYLLDQRAVASLPLPACIQGAALPLEGWPDARVALAFANIALRSIDSSIHMEILDSLPEPLRLAGNRLAKALLRGDGGDLGDDVRSLLRYGHRFGEMPRFLVT